MAFAVGTTVHGVLELADLTQPRSLFDVGLIARVAESAARRHAVSAADVADAATGILTRFGSGPLAARLAKVRVLAREVPLLAAGGSDDGSEAVHGYADLVFEEEGHVVVADYKSDLIMDEESLALATSRYRAQVRWYADALSRSLKTPVRAELLFVSIDRAVVV